MSDLELTAPSLSKDLQGRMLVTRSSLVDGLRWAGLRRGDVVCVHTALSKLGYVCGAAQTVIDALQETVGPEGSIMMPTFSGEHSDPATWRHPPVPDHWVEIIRREMPGFDAALTPTRQMGAVAELFRQRPNVSRSAHPHSSFAAWGERASELIGSHSFDFRFGPGSPLGNLVALDGKVLLLGAGSERASFVYLAQTMAGIGPVVTKSAPLASAAGRPRWVEYRDVAVDNRLVVTGVERLLQAGIATTSTIGNATAVVFPARRALGFLLSWKWEDAGFSCPVVRTPINPPDSWLLNA